MIVTCTGCRKRYNFDESKLRGKATGTLRCPACGTLIKVAAPQAPAAAAPAPRPPGANVPTPGPPAPGHPAEQVGDRTTRLEADASLVAARPQASEGRPFIPPGQRVSLAVLHGKNSGTIFPVDKPRIVLGRSGADVVLDDGEISRQHASIEIHGTRIVLKDLGSTNGTFVDENKISQTEIDSRSEFRIGGTRLMLIVTQAGTDPGGFS